MSLSTIRSAVPEIDWPPILTGRAAALAALIGELEDSQWAAPDEIAARQAHQLGLLSEYCAKHSKFFSVRLARAGLRPADLAEPGGLSKLPVLTRRDVQSSMSELYCAEVPPGHGTVSEAKTSGSTGEPVVVRRTAINNFIWLAMTMREHLWHGRDFAGGLCSIRANIASYERRQDWGPPASLLFRTGPSLVLPIAADARKLVEWVADFRPGNLLIYPSTLDAFTVHCRRHGISLPQLIHIRTVGETLSPSIRAAAASTFGAKVSDCYSSQEIGYIALECPASGLYHVMAEGVIAEVLNDDGIACKDGEVGRIAVTDLHNFATPLVRYDIGDYAQAGPACPCGRTLPTWRRILGRERNLILMPDGSRHWPLTGLNRCRGIAPVTQYQLVQHDREAIEARLVVERALTQAEENALRALFCTCAGHEFALRFSYFGDRIPPDASGKFEEFVCKVSA